ncbi:hypothetical protein AMTRI_Chr02g221680 [Amborella trichopoda]
MALHTHHPHKLKKHILSLIRACTCINHLQQIHAHAIITSPSPPSSSYHAIITTILTGLLHLPTTSIHYAKLLFNHLYNPSIYHLNSIIRAMAHSPSPCNAITFFTSHMHTHRPNHYTFQFLLKALSLSSALSLSLSVGFQLHSFAYKLGMVSYTFFNNGLIHLYSLCGHVFIARQLFNEMGQRDEVSYSSMINGYVKSGELGSALDLFKDMPELGSPSAWTAILVGYSDNGDLGSARKFFDEMPEKDVVAWNAMVSGYTQNGLYAEAIFFFREMQKVQNLKPNATTMATILSACAGLGALDTGKWTHAYIERKGMKLDAFLGSALVDMYSKCGEVELGLQVFTGLKQRKNLCAWNAMINGLAIHGRAAQALEFFKQLRKEGIEKPDQITFIGVLSACSHGGFIDQGRAHFYNTMKIYGVKPIVEHYACMVDLLGRSGFLDEAEEVIRNMVIKPDIVVWRALLGGCRLHKNVQIGERVIAHMEAHSSGDYVLLSNIYASAGRWVDVSRVRKMMQESGIKKVPGWSSIEFGNVIHEFVSGDKTHPRYGEIYEKLDELKRKLKKEGYLAETGMVLYDIEEEEKEEALGHHSEKLAIGLGLISTPPGSTLRIVKNLRVCSDCHSVTKLISLIYGREIVVRDRIRFHHFNYGTCSCKDYW